MRYHELALQRWLNQVFILRWGAPTPVVFSSPLDAFSEFTKLWAAENNPYKYLLDVKDSKGNPLYLPHPAPVRYPVISVYRKNYKLRNSNSFSIHQMRHVAWPTVSDDVGLTPGKDQQGVDLKLGDMGNVVVARYPMAVDYRFQLDFFCNRPDTQSFFLTQFWREFWRTGGPQLQTWIPISYPLIGKKLIRLYVDGEVENMTPENPEDGKNVEFRVSLTLVVEGYEVDLQYRIHPTLWRLAVNSIAAPPSALGQSFNFTEEANFTAEVDMRDQPLTNPTVENRVLTETMPQDGDYADDTNEPG